MAGYPANRNRNRISGTSLVYSCVNQRFSLIIITNNIKPFFSTAHCSKNVCWRSRQFGTSAEVSARHFGTGAELSRHFGTSLMCRNVLGPKCPGSEVSWHLKYESAKMARLAVSDHHQLRDRDRVRVSIMVRVAVRFGSLCKNNNKTVNSLTQPNPNFNPTLITT